MKNILPNCSQVSTNILSTASFVLDKGLAAMGLFFIHVYSYLHLVLNFASFSDLGLATMGLDLVSFTVLDLGLAAVGLDLVSFLSLYSKPINSAESLVK